MAIQVQYVDVGELSENELNAKIHDERNVVVIAKSIATNGFLVPIVAATKPQGGYEIVDGHGRYLAALQLRLDEVPIVLCDHLDEAHRKEFSLAVNQACMMTGWDDEKLDAILEDLSDVFDMEEFGFDFESGLESIGDNDSEAFDCFDAEDSDDETSEKKAEEKGHASLAERFGISPFSVLNARSGEWMERKRAWLATGIRSELGRGAAPGGGTDAAQSRGGGGLGSHITSMQEHRPTGGGRTLGAIASNQKQMFEMMKGK